MISLVDEINHQYDLKRDKNEKLLEIRKNEINKKIPAISELDKKIITKRGELFRCFDEPQEDIIKKELEELLSQKRLLLKENGYPENYLDRIYDCPACRDTGTDEKTNSRCECFERALMNEKYKELGTKIDNISFEDFDLSIFPDKDVVLNGYTQRQLMQTRYDVSIHYAESFPQTDKSNLIFSGKTGLGKTYLLKCIAKRIIQRGFSCVYVTSYNLFDMLKKQYFGETSSADDLYETPLLIIDDLGTEPLMKNITSECLFLLLNERVNRRLHTLFATNLEPLEIKERYGERILSRILSKENTDLYGFAGKDVRLIKKQP